MSGRAVLKEPQRELHRQLRANSSLWAGGGAVSLLLAKPSSCWGTKPKLRRLSAHPAAGTLEEQMDELVKSLPSPTLPGLHLPCLDAHKGWLFKWTNYLKGYQRRWFVLSNGLLSYYRWPYRSAQSGRQGSARERAQPHRWLRAEV